VACPSQHPAGETLIENALANSVPFTTAISPEAALVRKALLERGLETPLVH
jgi:hypothetical protein